MLYMVFSEIFILIFNVREDKLETIADITIQIQPTSYNEALSITFEKLRTTHELAKIMHLRTKSLKVYFSSS
jgi:hypothetical protein